MTSKTLPKKGMKAPERIKTTTTISAATHITPESLLLLITNYLLATDEFHNGIREKTKESENRSWGTNKNNSPNYKS